MLMTSLNIDDSVGMMLMSVSTLLSTETAKQQYMSDGDAGQI